MPASMTTARLKQFSDAWDRGDIDDVMSFFTEDCVFHPSIEETPGATFHGRTAVAEEFRRIFARDKIYQSHSGLHVVFGSYGYCEWSLVGPNGVGKVEIRGCDFFEFRGGMIAKKDAFRKSIGWLDKSD
jgi:ketosteroid isomerase-like protein